ncbi:nucleic acid binding protein [Elderberry carlavirus C]|uniref:RNA silencing suppressor n=1 Tax=Elderberry carlavirus C TaxID=1569054 RepID=A0A0A7MB67_9VIRU|nr:nucleic acid binding protein [Elderberry carlavirus C]AIZ76630.1 nucleic acid binding protein [Elderberry carlavirus C]
MGSDRLSTMYLVLWKLKNVGSIDLCVLILSLSKPPLTLGGGSSSYAKKRRAAKIGRCWRCFRVVPPPYHSKCDGRTCRPGISYRWEIALYISRGVTEVIPLEN